MKFKSRNLPMILIGFFILLMSSKEYLSAQGWHSANGPYAGKVNAVFFTPEGSCFAGTDNDGIYRLSSGSSDWRSVNQGLEHRTVWCFAQNASGGLFAGTLYGGIYFSSNGGDSWNQINEGLSSFDIRSITVTRNNVLIAGTVSGGAFRSTDEGLNWTSASSGMSAHMILSLVVDSNNNIFAGTAGQGVFRSTDDGRNWFEVNNGLINSFIWSLAAGPENELLAGSMGGGVHRSTNAGASWTPIGVSESYINALAVMPQLDFFAATRGKGVYRSTNCGLTWALVSSSMPDSIFWALAFDHSGNIYTGSDQRGCFQSVDRGHEWIPFGIPNVRLFCLHQSSGSDLFAGAYRNGLFFSSDNGNHWSWMKLLSKNTDVHAVLSIPQQYVFLATQSDGILRSAYPLGSWTKINNGLPVSAIHALASADAFIFAGTRGNGIYRSSDNGHSWQSTGLTSSFIKKIISFPPNGLFAASIGDGVFRSTDQGQNWFPVNSGLTSQFIYDVIYDGSDYLFAAADNVGVFRSSNQGVSWEEKNNGLHGINIRVLSCADNIIYSGGTGSGLYFSPDHGDSWSVLPSSDSIRNIIGIQSDPNLTVATEYNGIFLNTQSISVDQKGKNTKPDRLIINAFPNPFNALVTFHFNIPERDRIIVSIYNILGHEMIKSDKGLLTPGPNRFTWNGKDRNGISCASGLYLFRLQGSKYSSVKKIMMIR